MNTPADPPNGPPAAPVPVPAPAAPGALPPRIERRRWNVSLIWLVPAIAVLVGLTLVIRSWTSTGPRIEVSFLTAEGLEAGKTQVKYKNVVIGSVSGITLAEDRTRVVVRIRLDKGAQAFATKDSRFWVVRPRVGAGGVTGIDTLLSGAFIGADAGSSQEAVTDFTGLELPPAVTHGEAGRQFNLHADDLGSLDIGSPVYYRRIQVGRVVGYQLDDNGRQVGVKVFVDAPHDRLVTRASRFWNASGFDLTLGADGLKVNTQSLATVLAGGISFQNAPGQRDASPAPADASYTLAVDEKTAMAKQDGDSEFATMRFDQPLRGLAVDAPVEFQGVEMGKVVSIDLDYDAAKQTFPTTVGAVLYPERLGLAYAHLMPDVEAAGDHRRQEILKLLVAKGLRAQARSGNLLTGQLYVALDFIPGAGKMSLDERTGVLAIPTVPGRFDKAQEQVAAIIDRVNKIPFDSIGKRLDSTIAELDKTLEKVNGEVLPDARNTLQGAQQAIGAVGKTLGKVDGTLDNANKAIDSAGQTFNSIGRTVDDDSALQRNLSQTLRELSRSARSLRDLTDYLGRHPESLIRGKGAGSDPPLPDQPQAKP